MVEVICENMQAKHRGSKKQTWVMLPTGNVRDHRFTRETCGGKVLIIGPVWLEIVYCHRRCTKPELMGKTKPKSLLEPKQVPDGLLTT